MAKQTDEKYQCGSCEQFFNELQNNCCPWCGSGNWVEGCIDEPISMKPDNTTVRKLRSFAQRIKYDVVLFPQCTFKEAVEGESDNGLPFVPVNVGQLLYFIADMMEK